MQEIRTLFNYGKEKITQCANLIEHNEELQKQADVLLADNAELRQQKSVRSAEAIQQVLQQEKEQRKIAAESMVEFGVQTNDAIW